MWYLPLVYRGLIPDALIRVKIRALLRERLAELTAGGVEAAHERQRALIASLLSSPIALETQAANEQHYEVPARFYELCLGRHRKYSCALFATPSMNLDDAEAAMIDTYVTRAGLAPGQDVLELGCGWGSLTLELARRFPTSQITGVSNSASQRESITARAQERGLSNVRILTADMNRFAIGETFDRVVSIEMFEHMRNYRELLARIAGWLRPDGQLFVHIFTHRDHAYPFEVRDESDWMAKYFFTGGIMPSDHLLHRFQEHLLLTDHWRVSGTHYQRTAEAWLVNLDRHRHEAIALLEQTHGPAEGRRRFAMWRIFFLSCAELWGFRGGTEWLVSHYLFRRR